MKKKLTAIQKFAQSGGKARWADKTDEEKKEHARKMGIESQRKQKEKRENLSTPTELAS